MFFSEMFFFLQYIPIDKYNTYTFFSSLNPFVRNNNEMRRKKMLVSFIFYLYHTLFNVQIILNKIP